MPFKKPDFTIDDAFSESAEDKIRLYTRTSESVPLTEETIQVKIKWIIYLNIDSFNTWLPRAYTVHMLTHIRKSPLVFLTPQARLMILRTSLSAPPPQQHLQLSKPKLFKIPPYRSQLFFYRSQSLIVFPSCFYRHWSRRQKIRPPKIQLPCCRLILATTLDKSQPLKPGIDTQKSGNQRWLLLGMVWCKLKAGL